MKGDLVFEVLGGVDACYILEADPCGECAPTAATIPEASHKSRRPLSGWVAAAVCAVVALSVYLGAMWLGQGEWQPPATTEEGTETVETVETDGTETVTDPEETEQPVQFLFQPFLTPSYVVEKINGKCYLNFYEGNSRAEYIGYIVFDDMEDMVTSIRDGHFTKEELWEIQTFDSLTTLGYAIVDIWDLAIPVLPDDTEIEEIHWSGDHYSVYFSIPSYFKSVDMTIQDTEKTAGWSKEQMEKLRQPDAEEFTVDGMTGILQTAANGKYKEIRLSVTDEATGREFYVSAHYRKSVSYQDPLDVMLESAPFQIYIQGTWENKEFSVRLYSSENNGDPELPKPTKDLILSFGIETYFSPAGEMPVIHTEAGYEVEKIDGEYYLTFPEYDFSPLDVYLSKEMKNLQSPYFTTLEDMYEMFMGEKRTLTLTEIIQYRVMMDEYDRVKLPNFDQLLDPIIPSEIGEMRNFCFDENGHYTATVWDNMDDIRINFSCVSEEKWLEKYEWAKDEISLYTDTDDVTVIKGFFDGMPCTFYEFGNQKVMTICEVIRHREGHEQRMIIWLYEAVSFWWDHSQEHSLSLEDLDYYDGCQLSIYGVKDGIYYNYYFGDAMNDVRFRDDSFVKPSETLLDQFSVTLFSP